MAKLIYSAVVYVQHPYMVKLVADIMWSNSYM